MKRFATQCALRFILAAIVPIHMHATTPTTTTATAPKPTPKLQPRPKPKPKPKVKVEIATSKTTKETKPAGKAPKDNVVVVRIQKLKVPIPAGLDVKEGHGLYDDYAKLKTNAQRANYVNKTLTPEQYRTMMQYVEWSNANQSAGATPAGKAAAQVPRALRVPKPAGLNDVEGKQMLDKVKAFKTQAERVNYINNTLNEAQYNTLVQYNDWVNANTEEQP